MKRVANRVLAGAVLLGLSQPLAAGAAEQDVLKKIEALEKQLQEMKDQMKSTEQKAQTSEKKADDAARKVEKVEEKSLGRWLSIGGDYRFRYDYLRGKIAPYYQLNPRNSGLGDLFLPVQGGTVKNNSLYTNRFGLNVDAKATQDVTVHARLLMYKVTGARDDAALRGENGQAYFSDRAGLFDGTVGHVPGDGTLAVDQVYATWKNIADQPIWFSIGRRPSTGGIPSHLKQNKEKPGNSGVPQLLVDYAFDGMTLGYAPDIESLPGAYVKFCYGRGFENGITDKQGNGLHDTDMLGFNIVPYDTDNLKAEFQYNRGMNIFNTPVMLSGPFEGSSPATDLGDIDWYGLNFLGRVKKAGPGTFHWFASGAVSHTNPNNNTVKVPLKTPVDFGAGSTSTLDTQSGLMWTGKQESKTGWAVYLGGRYDIEATGTKLGFEYNHGSKDWITFAPAADDMWTSKVGARGNVYEGYIIQELKLKPISSYLSKTFFKIGYQYYDFDYTGSNNWVGAPVKISGLGQTTPQMLTPLKSAQDLYATFEVHF
ncbi:hypothetical protein GeomeDRAFT_3164 [Geobacter metallireducens RCH3]|uniref:DUF3373 domain-containing protein n=1 Tax=Geobacter metallireducens (strain ATCC 53774 / DSM 7210 / GS-15) TaxID=269799 RepID=Q39R20_GEOMG|nr:DUF3373 family protein [Geobacter metallireducens]ABB33304.1 protein of unknown function DUF3373 [Geobacter metallireducens GS-15]EHP84271.1 hypothetical protein GeomeDRAFT_3164 [Geobacter metallireducens RCH3]